MCSTDTFHNTICYMLVSMLLKTLFRPVFFIFLPLTLIHFSATIARSEATMESLLRLLSPVRLFPALFIFDLLTDIFSI